MTQEHREPNDPFERVDQGLGADGQGVTYASFSQGALMELLNTLSRSGMSDAFVGQCCGVHRAAVRRWREGQSMPRNFQQTYLTLRGMQAEWLGRDEVAGPAMRGTGL